MDKIKEIRRFFLLQVNDALFPIGGYPIRRGWKRISSRGLYMMKKQRQNISVKN